MKKPIAIVAGLVLIAALTGCGEDGGDSTHSGKGASSNSGNGSDPKPDGQDDADVDVEEAPPLDHSAALAAGLSGDLPITCRYIYDDQEFAQMKIAAMGGEVNPEATVYFNGSTVYWDIPKPGTTMAHILGHEGVTYSWRIPDDGLGLKAVQENPAADLDIVKARMTKNASDCTAYTGPDSIFSPPGNITFEFVPE